MEKADLSFLKEDEYLYITPQGLQRFAEIYDPKDPLKHILWTNDYTVELPIKLRKSGPGSEVPKTLVDMFEEAHKEHSTRTALRVKRGGKMVTWTYDQFYQDTVRFAKGLLALGISAHKALNIIGFNAPEWFIAFYGGIYASVLPIGVYTTNSSEACHYVAEDSEAELVILEDTIQLNKYLAVWSRLPKLRYIIIWGDSVPTDLPAEYQNKVITFAQILQQGDTYKASGHNDSLESRIALQAPGKCCTLVYTSGTTGNPKGVMLSHDNYVWTARRIMEDLEVRYDVQEKIVSYLPLSHVAGQIVDVIGCVRAGVEITFADASALQGSLVNYLKEVKPTGFFSVPRVWEKIEEKIKLMAVQNGALKQYIANWAKDLGKRGTLPEIMGEGTPFGYGLAKSLIFSNIRKAIGLEDVKYFAYGAAPMSLQTREYFLSLGIFLYNVYGMSETSGPATFQTFKPNYRPNLKSAGTTLEGTHIMIYNPDKDGEGEICFRGRHCFMGYLKNDQETVATLDSKGYVHSGDLGRFDEYGNLLITGRIKELIVTAGGENIAPVQIESKIKELLPFVSNVVVIGDKRKYLVALITLKHNEADGQPIDEFSEVTVQHLKAIGVDPNKKQEVFTDVALHKVIQEAIDKTNKESVSRAAHIRKWTLIRGDLSVAGNEITPTLKLKRKVVYEKHIEVIERMYLEPKL